MGRRALDLTDQKFGRLIVQASVKNKWKCICACGNITVVATHDLTRKFRSVKSCGCLRKELASSKVGKMAASKFSHTSAMRKVIRDYKQSAKKRGLSWELDDVLVVHYMGQPCHYCKTLQANKSVTHNKGKNSVCYYNGLDRLDNSVGYTSTNVVPCCYICNRAKNTLSLQEWHAWISKLFNNYFGAKCVI